jgi:hypothetical protein
MPFKATFQRQVIQTTPPGAILPLQRLLRERAVRRDNQDAGISDNVTSPSSPAWSLAARMSSGVTCGANPAIDWL